MSGAGKSKGLLASCIIAQPMVVAAGETVRFVADVHEEQEEGMRLPEFERL